MNADLTAALRKRLIIEARGLDLYGRPELAPEAVYTVSELEAILRDRLVGLDLDYPIRTRSKIAKERVSLALGYVPPRSFKKVQPRFPAQDLDVVVQQSDNVQVWNAEVSPTRRYVLIRVNPAGAITTVRVIEGAQLAALDRTGTWTSKFQASRKSDGAGSRLVSATDTAGLIDELEPRAGLSSSQLGALSPVSAPVRGAVLPIGDIYTRALQLCGRTLAYSSSERVRGERLHRLVCEVLDLGGYADRGSFPDIVCQALEVKFQIARTVDLGLISPDSDEPALTLSPRLRHSDTRYLVAYGTRDADEVTIDDIDLSTGADFFEEFRLFGGLVQNRKRQIPLPPGFFEAE